MLSDFEITKLIADKQLIIEPFDMKRLGPVSYDLKTVQESSSRGVKKLVTVETIQMPYDVAGVVMARSRVANREVFTSFGPLVDPGYKGKLIFLVWKPGNPNEDYNVSDLFQIVFFRIKTPAVTYDQRPESTAMLRSGFDKEKYTKETTDSAKDEPILVGP